MSSPQTPGDGPPKGTKRKNQSSPPEHPDSSTRQRLENPSGIMSVEEYWRQQEIQSAPASHDQPAPHTQDPVDQATPEPDHPFGSSHAVGTNFDQMLKEMEAEEKQHQGTTDQPSFRKDSGYAPQQHHMSPNASGLSAKLPTTSIRSTTLQEAPSPLDIPTPEELEAGLHDHTSQSPTTEVAHGTGISPQTSPTSRTPQRGQRSTPTTPSSPPPRDEGTRKPTPEYRASSASKAAHQEGPRPKHKRTFDVSMRNYDTDDEEDRLELFWALYHSVEVLLRENPSVAVCRLRLHTSYQKCITDLANAFDRQDHEIPGKVGHKGWFNYFEDWDCAWSGRVHDTEAEKQALLEIPKAQRAAIKEASRPILVNVSQDRNSSETRRVESAGIRFGQWVDVALDQAGKMVIVGMDPTN